MVKIQKLSEDRNGLIKIKNAQCKISKSLHTKVGKCKKIYRKMSFIHHYHVMIFDKVRKTGNNDKAIYV